MRKITAVVIIALALFVSVSAQGEKRNNRSEERDAFREKIEQQFGDMIAKNKLEIEKIKIELEKNQLAQKEEMMKEKPDWSKVERTMEESFVLRNKIEKIHQQQFLTIAKTLTPEERMKMGKMHNMRKDHMRDGNNNRMMEKKMRGQHDGNGPGNMGK